MRRSTLHGFALSGLFALLLVLPSACGGDEPVADPSAKTSPGQTAGARPAAGPGARKGPPGRPGQGAPQEAVPIRVAAVERRDIASVYGSSTTIRPARTAPVPARAAGILRRTLVEEGDRVRAGAAMALLEDDQARLEQQQAKVNLEIAESELERAERLKGENLVSIEEYDQKRNAAAQARTQLELAQLNFAFTRVTAPFSGTVTQRLLDAGSTVSAGEAVFELVDTSMFYADVAVPESVAASLEVGGGARLVSSALGTTLPARIERLAPSVDPATGTVKVTLAMEPQPGLRSGGFVDVQIQTDVHENALVTPAEALVADGDSWHLFAIQDGAAVRVAVEAGFEDPAGVEITPLEGGAALDAGSLVAVGGVAALSDGTPVRVEGADSDAAAKSEDVAAGPSVPGGTGAP